MASPRRTKVDIAPLMAKLKAIPGAMEEVIVPLVKQEARLFVRDVVKVTPPASAGVSGMRAKKQGESAVAGDISKIYGTASRAYVELALRDKKVADAFWKAMQAGDLVKAKALLQKEGGSRYRGLHSIAPFDGGTMHKRFRNSQGRISRWRVVMLVTNESELRKYIKQEQGGVGILASGWARAARKLGQSLPAWVTRHGDRRGACVVIQSGDKVAIIISNKVRYGIAQDMQRRADYVLGYRRRALAARMPYVIRAALKKARLGG
jgi:hypothetical protein